MKRLLVLLLFVLNIFTLSATHNRAGEITYEQKSDLTYEITITTFTYTLSLADRPELDVDWGDNSISTASRISKVILPNYYQRNIYKIRHTFPGPGAYKIVVQDPNRNYGVKNIPNSVNVVFSISTLLIVNPAMGLNNTPVLLNPPYDKAALGYVFIHNPAAYDPDGDSLSYKLTVCTREDGKPIENYTLPPATQFIRVDSVSGDLIWNTPADTGIYNVAMEIQEWRNGKKIGTVVRDMQIEVFVTSNKPPVNGPLKDLCVEVGESVDFIVSASDANNDRISLRATSGIFGIANCPADFIGIDSVKGSSHSRFVWTPCHEAVRTQPYNIIFKADDDNAELKLSDIDNMTIKVLGPSPQLLNAVARGNSIELSWANYGTTAIAGFNIYRREEGSPFTIDSCTSGIPSSTGFVRVGFASGSSSVTFTDNNNGSGLELGKEYFYRICAVYKNGTESKSSNERNSTLVSGIPVIRNVSVTATDADNGSIYLAWQKPDTVTPPFEYRIYRARGIAGTDFKNIATLITSNPNDTIFVDNGMNTRDSGYIYNISLRSKYQMFVDSSYASSVFINLTPGDEKTRFIINRNVPWVNFRYDIFRYNNVAGKYDSVGSTTGITYVDENLQNGIQYCYYVRSAGEYADIGMPKNIINLSQTACSTPVDNEPPCVPEITVTSQCDSMYNTINWSFNDPACLDDVAGYKIFYKEYYGSNLDSIYTETNKNIFSYIHDSLEVVAACYAVSAYDSLGNESEKSLMVCIDSCSYPYEIPNVFTPNNDTYNDRLLAKTSGLVESVDFKLFNRSGLLVFSTDNPRIDWDGTYKGKVVSPGVYFYQCDVFENRLGGPVTTHKTGFVHVITEEGVKVKPQETK
ncbi:MAG: gliding motility-associated C-terminal domain-containing protein [Bacteroidales bacterium]|jgi:gliding motility-associated-like protein|nr:gliding motility-associated C-terminal domain-containing protein [Bacteroidales bacterium]